MIYLVKAIEPGKPVVGADGVSVQRPENQGARSVNAGVILKVWEPRQEKMSQLKQRGQIHFLSPLDSTHTLTGLDYVH